VAAVRGSRPWQQSWQPSVAAVRGSSRGSRQWRQSPPAPGCALRRSCSAETLTGDSKLSPIADSRRRVPGHASSARRRSVSVLVYRRSQRRLASTLPLAGGATVGTAELRRRARSLTAADVSLATPPRWGAEVCPSWFTAAASAAWRPRCPWRRGATVGTAGGCGSGRGWGGKAVGVTVELAVARGGMARRCCAAVGLAAGSARSAGEIK